MIIRNLGWQSYECSKTAADLSDALGYDKALMARTLKLLEDVGAIRRVRRGRSKVITVTPEGAFRGNVHEHGKSVERYRLDVIEGGRRGEDDPEG
jgi:DNA-binding transcriptional ArsR family regulator